MTLEFPNSGAVHALDLAALGEITGVVLDPGGVPVAGALVALGSLGVSVLTGSDGSFALGNLPIGEYELSVVPPAGSGWRSSTTPTASTSPTQFPSRPKPGCR